jgi:hypothetical protein
MVAVVAAAAFTSILLFGGDTIFNQGRIEAAELCVYWERACINEVPSINWGYVEPGSSNTVTIFVRNEGAAPVSVNLATDDWNPTPVASYVTFDADLESYRLSPQSVLEVDLTLAVSPDVAGISDFSFDIVITGSDS